MSRNYKFHNPKGLYFVSFAVVYWLAIFTRNEYKKYRSILEFELK